MTNTIVLLVASAVWLTGQTPGRVLTPSWRPIQPAIRATLVQQLGFDPGFDEEKEEPWRGRPALWVGRSAGCYMLRTNVTDWTSEELWRAYIQLTQAEDAFRIHKSDLKIRPIWHQRSDRVQAHILVCFLAFVLWKALGQMAHAAGLGDEPRQILDEIKSIRMADIVAHTREGHEIRKRCIVEPTRHQAILLSKQRLNLPSHLPATQM